MLDNGAILPVNWAIGEGYRWAMVIDDTGALWGMGENDYGQLGPGTTAGPVDVARQVCATAGDDTSCGTLFDSPVAQVSVGSSQTLFVTEDGRLFGMGRTLNGALGHGVDEDISQDLPLEVGPDQTWMSEATQGRAAIAITPAGAAYVFGRPESGTTRFALDATAPPLFSPTLPPTYVDLEGAVLGESTGAAWDAAPLYTSGGNDSGLLGIGRAPSVDVPTLVDDVPWTATPTSVSMNSATLMVATDDGAQWGVGGNFFGELSLGHRNPAAAFTPMCAEYDDATLAGSYRRAAIRRCRSAWSTTGARLAAPRPSPT